MEKTREFDSFQLEVIQADPDSRLYVEAGPGTGKTTVAIERIIKLTDGPLYPTQVLMISFTRTAVWEFGQRIKNLRQKRELVAGVRVLTLDSLAWLCNSAFLEESIANLVSEGDYNDSILALTALIKDGDERVKGWLAGFQHIVIDEVQDIRGVRKNLVQAMIEAVSGSCGVTALGDSAQQIFDWDKDNDDASLKDTLIHEMGFNERILKNVYRTGNDSLVDLFGRGREILLNKDLPDTDKYSQVRTLITRSHNADAELNRESPPPGTLVLFRSRAAVLAASWQFAGRGISHDFRMGGAEQVIPSWVGGILYDFASEVLREDEFLDRWINRIEPIFSDRYDVLLAWECLLSVAGDGNGGVSIEKLRGALLRSRPPIEFSMSNLDSKTVLGTIHSSKGREANEVWLVLPGPTRKETGSLSEARVMYVGATRAKEKLQVTQQQSFVSNVPRSYIPWGRKRHYDKPGLGWALLESGKLDDICRYAHLGRILFRQPKDALDNQKALMLLDGLGPVRFHARKTGDLSYQIDVAGRSIGSFNNLSYGINKAVMKLMGSSPITIEGYVMGTTTIALHPDEMQRSDVYSDYFPSGIVLSPVVSSLIKLVRDEQ